MSELNLNQVNPEENLTRYLLQKSHFSILYKRVKYAAFMPTPNGETSVFRISNLSATEIWKIGDSEVAQKRGLPLLGRADISAFKVLDKNLKVIPDNIPPRHANIIGWPDKSKQKLVAIELADNAQLYLR